MDFLTPLPLLWQLINGPMSGITTLGRASLRTHTITQPIAPMPLCLWRRIASVATMQPLPSMQPVPVSLQSVRLRLLHLPCAFLLLLGSCSNSVDRCVPLLQPRTGGLVCCQQRPPGHVLNLKHALRATDDSHRERPRLTVAGSSTQDVACFIHNSNSSKHQAPSQGPPPPSSTRILLMLLPAQPPCPCGSSVLTDAHLSTHAHATHAPVGPCCWRR